MNGTYFYVNSCHTKQIVAKQLKRTRAVLPENEPYLSTVIQSLSHHHLSATNSLELNRAEKT